jgi:hypothetical protein
VEDGALRMSPSSTMGDMAAVTRPEGERMPRTGDLWVGECPGVEATLAREGSSDPAWAPTQHSTVRRKGGRGTGRREVEDRRTQHSTEGQGGRGDTAMGCQRVEEEHSDAYVHWDRKAYISSDISVSITRMTA